MTTLLAINTSNGHIRRYQERRRGGQVFVDGEYDLDPFPAQIDVRPILTELIAAPQNVKYTNQSPATPGEAA